jgi:predicted metal-dependent phosphoesterase TrpH
MWILTASATLLALLPAPAPAAPAMNHYTGLFHTHTGYSDGVVGSRPADAYVRSRDVEGLDFAAVTEHSEALDVPSTLSEGCLPTAGGTIIECALADAPGNAINKWEAQRRQAIDTTRADEFIGLRGFEETSDVYGHINVYFSRNFTNRVRDLSDAAIEPFYQWLRTPAAAGGGDDGLATFNHPNDKCRLGTTSPQCNWNDFAFRPELDDRVVGIEIYNRDKNYEPWTVRALDKGWHVGVVGAEDIHEDDWGAQRYGKTVFIAPHLTMPDLKAAMAERRMYATLDHDVRITFTGPSGEQMGSRISAGGPVTLTAHVDGGEVTRVDLLSNGGAVAASSAGRDLAFEAPMASERWYMVRVATTNGEGRAYSSPIWIGASSNASGFSPRWVAGDLHVHTTYSHDVCSTPPTPEQCDPDGDGDPTDPYTWGWSPGEQITNAEMRGLDFVAITDHNDTRSVYDAGYSSDRITLMPAYENSLAGHAQMLNAISCYAPEGRVHDLQHCNDFPNRDERERIKMLRDAIRAGGGAFQINHPSDMSWVGRFGDGSSSDPIVPDSVEVWNIGPWAWQHPMPASNDNDFSLRFWEGFLNAGYHVAATGGSDNHWRSTFAAQGVGQPTTWVYTTRPGAAGIVDGIRAGRTSISYDPPSLGGPTLFVEADADADGDFESMIGDTVPSGTEFRVRADGAPPGAVYRVVTDEETLESSGPIVVRPRAFRWVRAELLLPDAQGQRMSSCDALIGNQSTYCRNRLIVLALTSAIYVS